ncbi:MAG TPA: FecR domain-containing protein [Puia sp.]|nr:FecR domain-containing protein [Puia sp.]
MEENQLWFLIARHLSGEISAGESNTLQELLKKHPDKHHLFDILQSYFVLPDDLKEIAGDSSMDDELRFRRIIEHSEDRPDLAPLPEIRPVKTRQRYRFWRYAATVACIAILAGLGFNYFRQPKPRIDQPKPQGENVTTRGNEFISRSGARTKLVLPDGSQVWLNAGSKLNYSNAYNETLREVDLEGEAYFDVVKATDRPFIVHASSLNIRAVGTAFVVKSYPQDETIETTLLRGIIEVTRKDLPDGPKVILKPNEKLIFSKQLETEVHRYASDTSSRSAKIIGKISVAAISIAIPDSNKVETSWVYNRLVFDGDTFQELAKKMERWYNVKIVIKNKELLRYRFKGAFENETITEALNALQLTAEFSYKINNNEVDVFKK